MASTITATEFFLSLLFASACLWMRRKPSNFLRFALSPFGGLNVERWPRFTLLLTRGVAIPGFIVFLLAVVNSVSPLSRDDLPTGADYLKLGIIVVISFLVLRGTNEEFPERAGSAKLLHAPKLRHTTAGPAPVSASANDAYRHLSGVEAPVHARAYAEIPPADDVVQPV